jgi:hypothetical protein
MLIEYMSGRQSFSGDIFYTPVIHLRILLDYNLAPLKSGKQTLENIECFNLKAFSKFLYILASPLEPFAGTL